MPILLLAEAFYEFVEAAFDRFDLDASARGGTRMCRGGGSGGGGGRRGRFAGSGARSGGGGERQGDNAGRRCAAGFRFGQVCFSVVASVGNEPVALFLHPGLVTLPGPHALF